jgi:hypothetical protein
VPGDVISSQPRDRNKGCFLCQENKISGLEGLAQGRNVEFDPTATFSRTDERTSPTDSSLTSGHPNAEAGLTARWSVTSNMTFNGTINPDFSQVEADVAQLDVNQRFALFYPEKRPFFLEGTDFFTTPIQAVFTRTVADPLFGAKLTGKQGGNAVGLFVTRDRINNLLFPANQVSSSTSLDDDVTTVVGRYRRDVGSGSTIGGIYAAREGEGYHHRQFFSQYLFSYKLNPQTVLFAGYSDNSNNAGGSQGLDLQRQNRTLFVELAYAWAI